MFRKTKVCTGLMLAFGGSLAVSSLPAMAQQQLERVEITGSSIRRVDAETALPVTIIKVEELVKQGVTTVEQAMARIASNQSNFGASASIGATTGGKSEADIRGLSGPTGVNSNKTLVLLNGRRIANHAFDAAAVDLNAIPLAAIERIEVLRDGASSLYGTDAIGGVINFIIKRDYRGLEVSAQTQQPKAKGGGDTNRVTLLGGFGSMAEQRFNVMASLDFRKQNVLVAADRKFSTTGILGTSRGAISDGTSGTSFPGDLNGFEPSGPLCNPPSSVPRNTNPDNSGAFQSCRYDFSHDVDIIPQNEQVTGLVRGSVAIAPDHTISAEYMRAHNKAISKVAPAPTGHIMPATSPFYPAGAPVGSVPDLINPGAPDDTTACGFTNCVPGGVANWRQVPAGKRTSGDDTTTERAMLEAQGLFAGWDYRTAIGRSKNKSTASVKRGYVNDDLMQLGVWNGVINPFGDQTAAGQAAIDAAQVQADTLIGTAKMDFVDFRVSKDLMQMAAGPLSAAFGFEHRKERSSFEATDITAVLGSLGIDPDSDTGGSRKVTAVFAELNIPITKQLELNAAARYDKYSDFGNTFNPKLGLRYQPTKEMLVRGSINTGFRAPTLYEIYQPASLTFTTDNYDDPLLCPGGAAVPGASAGVVCGQQVLQRTSGPAGIGQPVSTLKPEKSRTMTVGLVFEPSSSVTLGVDLWKIVVRNLISPLPEQAVFGDATKYSARFVRCSQLAAGPGPGQDRSDVDVCLNFPSFDPIAFIDTPVENLGELHTHGVDLSAAWRSGATPSGNWGLSMEGTYITSYRYQRERGGAFIDAVGRYSDNAPVFRWQHTLTGTWSQGPWGSTLAQRFKSSYTDQDPAFQVGAYAVWDLSVSWTGIKNLTVTAGINNLFDIDPPKSVQNTTFQRGYDPRFSDPLGRTYMFRAAYKFF
ncbi:TonB-dependent receptor [Piscinibacter sp.]|jgi:iron complex outermembrane receptor protein|uniref:TonB-dependent receptor n=1 Tax=Piscinibacter sp. TaxID=1903157 RepID=UPI002F407336